MEVKCNPYGTLYQALIKQADSETCVEVSETYIGFAAKTFHERHQNHQGTFMLRSH